MTPGRESNRATVVGGERSHHWAIPAPLINVFWEKGAISLAIS